MASCKKENDDPNAPAPPESCSTNSGSFEVSLLGNDYQMILDAETQFSILYDWYSPGYTDFIIDAKDQNGSDIDVECSFEGSFAEGQSGYPEVYFHLDIDTLNLYSSSVNFDVLESDLSGGDGIYRPIKSTFEVTAHSYPFISGQAPADTILVSGSFCLNGIILP